MIPLIDIAIDKRLLNEIKKEITQVINSKNYILGEKLESFEKKFAEFIGVRRAVGVGNGTDALRLSLRALGIGQDDKVLTVSLTSPFTSIAIVEEGAIPIFCDVDETSWTINVADVEKKIDKKTKAIIPVHLFGNPCDMKSILKIAKKHKLKVIEDACQAQGAIYQNKKIGSFGDAAAFSFYPTKNLGGMGDGGIVVTNNKGLATKIRILRHGGQTKRFWHKFRGINSRLDELQCAILERKLTFITEWNINRRKIAQKYKKNLSNLPLKFQTEAPEGKSVFHIFAVRTNKRNKLKKFLLGEGVETDIYYPFPLHVQPAFCEFAKDNVPVTTRLSRELLALPIYPTLKEADQDLVIAKIKKFFEKRDS